MSLFHDVCQALNVTGIRLRYLRTGVSADESRWTLAILALAGDDATSLCGDRRPLVLSGQMSWLSWPDDLEDGITLNAATKLPANPCISQITYSHITLDLLLIDKERTCYPDTDCWNRAETFCCSMFVE